MERVKTGLEAAPDEAFWTSWLDQRPDQEGWLKAAFDGVPETWATAWSEARLRLIWALCRQFAHEVKSRQKQPGEAHLDDDADFII